MNYYESNGWKVGRNPMKSWKGAVVTWMKNGYSNSTRASTSQASEPQLTQGTDGWDYSKDGDRYI